MTAAALDAKLMGMLGFMAAAAAVMLTVAHGLASNRWLLLIAAGGAIVIGLTGLVWPADLKSGPNPIEFYDEFGGVHPTDFAEQLLADLGETITLNSTGISARRALLSTAFAWAACWGIAFGVARAFS
jgi:hypothetical protein